MLGINSMLNYKPARIYRFDLACASLPPDKERLQSKYTANQFMMANKPSTQHESAGVPLSTDNIPETNPESITCLWNLVRANDMNDRSNTIVINNFCAPTPTVTDSIDDDDDATTRKTKSRMSSRSGGLKPGYQPFAHLMLAPRGIRLPDDDNEGNDEDAFEHFGTLAPAAGVSADQHYASSHSANLCVDSADRRLVEAVRHEYQRLAVNEPSQLNALLVAVQNLFHAVAPARLLNREDFRPNAKENWLAPPPLVASNNNDDDDDDDDNDDSSVALVVHPPPPPPPQPEPEPQQQQQPLAFAALVPDLSFWLCSTTVAPQLRSERLARHVHMRLGDALLPYLSVRVRARAREVVAARHELAAAAAIALFNRHELHHRRHPYNDNHHHQLRHYAILVAGHKYEVLRCCMRGSDDDDDENDDADAVWAGCRVARLSSGCLDDPLSVQDLMQWINEIHAWGAGAYAEAVSEDLLRVVGDMRSVAVGPLADTVTERLTVRD